MHQNGNGQSHDPARQFEQRQEPSAYEKFQRYWWLVKRKWWLVVLFALIGGAYKYNEVLQVEERFRSTATVMLDGAPTNRAVSLLGVPGARYGYENEMYILRSEQLSQIVAENLLESFHNSDQSDTLNILKAGGGQIATVNQIANRARSAVGFSEGGEKDNIIYFRSVRNDPEEAARIANVYANTYEQFNVDQSVRQIRNTKEFLEERISDTQDSLMQSEMELFEFYREHGYSQYDVSSEATIQQISNLRQEKDQARIQMLSNQEQINAIDSTLKAGREQEAEYLLNATDNLMQYYSNEIANLEVEKEKLINDPTSGSDAESNPRLAVLENRLEDYRSKYRELLQEKLDSPTLLTNRDGSMASHYMQLNAQKIELQNENSALPAKIERIEEQIAEYTDQMDQIPYQELEFEKLKRSRDRHFESLFSFYNKQQEMELALASEGGYVRVLDYAQPNYHPINKQASTGVFQGGFFGIAIAVLLIVGYDRIDDRIKSDEDIRELPVGLTGAIPSMKPIIQKELNNKTFLEYKGAFISTSLISVLRPLSGISEMYRRLRSNFLFSMPDKKNKSVLITSSNPQEGKSVTTANLGAVLAQSGKQVLLIDADLRRPNLDVFFGITGTPGLSDYIIGNAEYDDVIYPTIAENLAVVPAGSQVPNPSEIVGSDMFRSFYEKCIAEYDYVIIDSPPMNSVVDATSVTDIVDMSLVVVNAGKTRKKDLVAALNMMHFNAHKVMGILLNNIHQKSFISDYNYYNNYNYYGNRSAEYKNGSPREPSLWDKLNT